MPETIFNVKTFGATGDSKTLDTEAINKTIIAAVKAGGGTVYFPAGTYLSYSIRLQSHISLYLDQGATILAASPSGDIGYDSPEPASNDSFQDFGHSHWHNSLIWGENLEDISILGPGKIYGKGLTRGGPYKAPIGNKAIALKLCRNVILKDFTILYGGHFGILATGVDNLTIDNLKIDTNRDGMDIDCCKNVRISNCSVNSPWDDGICLKSSFALGFNRPTENVTITNCSVSGFDRGTFYNGTYQRNEANLVPDKEGPTGRIKFGTESNGGFKNITISNCVFEYCRGLALETVDGAVLEDVTITNITMRDIINSPIFLRLGARMRAPEGTPVGTLRRINISNINVYNADSRFATLISGIPGHDIEDVRLSNISIWYRPLDSQVTNIQKEVPEYEKAYPEPQKFGVLPAYGFFIRHAKNLELNNINLYLLGNETRPAMIVTDVKGIKLRNIAAQKGSNAELLVLKDVSNLSIKDCKPLKNKEFKKTRTKSY
ncbi:rhamnogalacturonidase [Flavobacterium sp. WC2509]|uniref:rhamnogalacturonidase n=1 Tax=Flavobacterium sp. WC2509 TaxID=3461406 RepID=UPI004044086B